MATYRLFYVQDVRSGFLFQTNPKYLHPCRQCRERRTRRSGDLHGSASVALNRMPVAAMEVMSGFLVVAYI